MWGSVKNSSDAGIFVHKAKNGDIVIADIYVDDAMWLGNNQALVKKLMTRFTDRWESRVIGDLTNGGPSREFLSLQIKRIGSLIFIDQNPYCKKILARFGMENARKQETPLPLNYSPFANKEKVDPELRTKYQQLIGSLLYLMIGTRPDIAFAVIKMASFSANPSQQHYKDALSILKYLAGTQNTRLHFNGATNKGIDCHSDSDWASDPNTRRSCSGYYVKLAGATITWTSRLQKTVALSSTEAEYMAMSDACRQAMWFLSLFQEISFNITSIPVTGDNMGSLFMGKNPVTEKRSKHIDIRYHYLREIIAAGHVETFFIEGTNNPADILTKNLGRIFFTKYRAELGLEILIT